MRAAGFALALLAWPAGAGSANCQERCMTSFQRCSGGCTSPDKCMKRCQDQLDGCMRSCTKETPDAKPPLPKKCPDAKGRMVPCDESHNDPDGLDKPPPVPRH